MSSTGWQDRFRRLLTLKRRVVLHGNVLDLVLEDGRAVALPQWLRNRAVDSGAFTRVVYYDHNRAPEVLAWEEDDLESGVGVLQSLVPDTGPGARSPSDPKQALPLMAALLARPEHRALVILANAEHSFRSPSTESVRLHELGRGTGTTGVVVHLYARIGKVPPEFGASEPDAAMLAISPPTLEERQAFLESFPEDARVRNLEGASGRVNTERFARITEGYRLRELRQLVQLADQEPADVTATELLSLFRFGKRVDYWANKQIEDVMDLVRGPIDDPSVRGQDAALGRVEDNLRRAKHRTSEMVDAARRRPAAVFFFVGATGVGKTLMATQICKAVTGSVENLKRFDMSEYKRDHADQRLIGPPPGYVGHEEGGQLTNWVQGRPHSVVLIDEVEKAADSVFDMFLQILDGARLTDGRGSTVDFSETVLIFTSNIGTQDGMDDELDKRDRAAVAAFFREKVEDFFGYELERPELYNRLKSGIVVFDFARQDDVELAIASGLSRLAAGFAQRLEGTPHKARIAFDPKDPEDQQVVKALLRRSQFERYGYREVNNVLEEFVEGEVARWLDAPPESRTLRFLWSADLDRVVLR